MVLVPASPNHRVRSVSRPSPSNPLTINENGRVTRHALNSLAWWQQGASRRHRLRHLDVPKAPYYVALRAALNAHPSPPSPTRSSAATRIRHRRPAPTKENHSPASASLSTPSSVLSTSSTSNTSTGTASASMSTSSTSTAVVAPWMRQNPSVPPSSMASFVSTPAQRGTLTAGSRVRHEPPLTLNALWLGGIEPPALSTPERPHQECAVCKNVKSCPAISGCGHSHCYPCIRLCLEFSFKCPTCRTIMTSAPFRSFTEEQNILFDNPTWNNNSRVDYSFEGLTFPRPM